ncbi:MAG: T9SS type A sorting domain-containing protein [Bacteroidota bacterium]
MIVFNTSFGKRETVCSFLPTAGRISILACLIFSFQLQAQVIEVVAEYLPDPYEDLDTTARFSASSNYSGTSLELIASFDGFDIDPQSEFVADFSQSPICSEGDCSVSIWLDTEGQDIHVLLERAGGFDPFSFQELLVLRGIDIVIDDIHRRAKPDSSPKVVYPNPSTGTVSLPVSVSGRYHLIEVFDMSGRLRVRTPLSEHTRKLNWGHLTAGLYLVKLYPATGKPHSSFHQIVR